MDGTSVDIDGVRLRVESDWARVRAEIGLFKVCAEFVGALAKEEPDEFGVEEGDLDNGIDHDDDISDDKSLLSMVATDFNFRRFCGKEIELISALR